MEISEEITRARNNREKEERGMRKDASMMYDNFAVQRMFDSGNENYRSPDPRRNNEQYKKAFAKMDRTRAVEKYWQLERSCMEKELAHRTGTLDSETTKLEQLDLNENRNKTVRFKCKP